MDNNIKKKIKNYISAEKDYIPGNEKTKILLKSLYEKYIRLEDKNKKMISEHETSLAILIENESQKIQLEILKWSGESNDLHPGEKITSFLNNVLENIQGTFIMQFQGLQFMNSSTIHPLIRFIKALDKKIFPRKFNITKTQIGKKRLLNQ